jgi:hypothetical protein
MYYFLVVAASARLQTVRILNNVLGLPSCGYPGEVTIQLTPGSFPDRRVSRSFPTKRVEPYHFVSAKQVCLRLISSAITITIRKKTPSPTH